MPPSVDPCLPAGVSGYGSATTTASVATAPQPPLGYDGSCGPQPYSNDLLYGTSLYGSSVSTPPDNGAGNGTAADGAAGGSGDARSQQVLPPSASQLPPTSPRAPAPPAAAASCAWRWLSCSQWRIVAVNLAYCGDAGGASSPAASSAPASSSSGGVDAAAAASATGGAGVGTGTGSGCISTPLRGFLPASAPQLSSLVLLDVSGQWGMTGGLPLTAWDPPWSSLKFLNMSGCGLAGPLPPDWSPLPALEVLDLSRNMVVGALPPGLASLSRLRQLRLAGSAGLLGYLPPAWAAMTELRLLDVTGVCRLCGSSSVLPGLVAALTSGSHLDTGCRLEECGGASRGVQGVFQGVMAGFACVLGLSASVLLVRRVHVCVTARERERLRQLERERGRGQDRSGGGWESGSGRSQYERRAARRRRALGPGGGGGTSDAADVDSDDDGRPRGYHGGRGRSRWRGRYAGQGVPLYTVEFCGCGATGGWGEEEPQWSVDLAVVGRARRRGCELPAAATAPTSPASPPSSAVTITSPLPQLPGPPPEQPEEALAPPPEVARSPQELEQEHEHGQEHGQHTEFLAHEPQRQTVTAPRDASHTAGWRGVGRVGDDAGGSDGGLALAEPATQQARGPPQPQPPLRPVPAQATGGGDTSSGGAGPTAPPPAAAAGPVPRLRLSNEQTRPSLSVAAPAALPRPGTPRPVDPAEGYAVAAVPPQGVERNPTRPHVGVSVDAGAGAVDSSGGGGVGGVSDGGSGEAHPPRLRQGDAGGGGGAAAAAATARRGEPLWKVAVRLARPPDAVILMPNGWEICLGLRVAAPPADDASQPQDGAACAFPRHCRCCCSDDEATAETAAAADAAATVGSRSADAVVASAYEMAPLNGIP